MSESLPLIYTPMNNWIKVTEQLPDIGKIVLIFCSGKLCSMPGIHMASRHNDKNDNRGDYWCIANMDYFCYDCDKDYFRQLNCASPITHWMPLPELPREVG
jgi:Protein of unknown function (DUF551)